MRYYFFWHDSGLRAGEIVALQLDDINWANAPALLRKTLHSTNPIESLFSRVRACEKNLKRHRNSRMAQRWLASVLLYARAELPNH
jgi:integrase